MLEPFILRRVKRDILDDLPPKAEVLEVLSMSPRQADTYTAVVDMAAARRSGDRIAVDKHAGSAKDVRNTYTALRKAANHPLLLCRHYQRLPEVQALPAAACSLILTTCVCVCVPHAPQGLMGLARLLRSVGAFGDHCTVQQVADELVNTSDFEIHM